MGFKMLMRPWSLQEAGHVQLHLINHVFVRSSIIHSIHTKLHDNLYNLQKPACTYPSGFTKKTNGNCMNPVFKQSSVKSGHLTIKGYRSFVATIVPLITQFEFMCLGP